MVHLVIDGLADEGESLLDILSGFSRSLQERNSMVICQCLKVVFSLFCTFGLMGSLQCKQYLGWSFTTWCRIHLCCLLGHLPLGPCKILLAANHEKCCLMGLYVPLRLHQPHRDVLVALDTVECENILGILKLPPYCIYRRRGQRPLNYGSMTSWLTWDSISRQQKILFLSADTKSWVASPLPESLLTSCVPQLEL